MHCRGCGTAGAEGSSWDENGLIAGRICHASGAAGICKQNALPSKPMRVIAGQYRSRTLVAPRGLATRPTSDRLRETLFNILGEKVQGASFADLYAGSGAVGIEALSRGAGRVCFAENAGAAVTAIRANLALLKIEAGYSIETRGVAAALRTPSATGLTASRSQASHPWDLVFLDPPYRDAGARSRTLTALGQDAKTLLAPDARVVVEYRAASEAPAERYGTMLRYRVLKQGDAALSFYAISPLP